MCIPDSDGGSCQPAAAGALALAEWIGLEYAGGDPSPWARHWHPHWLAAMAASTPKQLKYVQAGVTARPDRASPNCQTGQTNVSPVFSLRFSQSLLYACQHADCACNRVCTRQDYSTIVLVVGFSREPDDETKILPGKRWGRGLPTVLRQHTHRAYLTKTKTERQSVQALMQGF
jgi:hypothetical protein